MFHCMRWKRASGRYRTPWRSLTAGGKHYWFELPNGAEIRGGNNKLGRGLDVKTGAGSYIVAPPSLHPLGVRYQWHRDAHPAETPLAVAPSWLIKLLTPPPLPPLKPFRPQTDDDRRIRDALMSIPVSAVDREGWVRIGMALRSEYGADGLELWDAWSRQSEHYGRKGLERVWKSFRGNGVTVATIFYLATEHGRVA
jgi:hypothetical protein